MPGPTTEAVNDDVKELRADFHRFEVALTQTITRLEVGLRAEIGRVEVGWGAKIAGVDKAVGQLAAQFALFKWLLGLALVTSLSGVISSAYWAGALASRVTALESRAEKTDGRLDRIEVRLGGIDSRLERIEANLARVLARIEGAGAAAPGPR